MKLKCRRDRWVMPTLLGLIVIVSAGCSEQKLSAKDEQQMRKQMTDKFDINRVPPDKRAMVEAMMKGSQAPQSAPGGAPSASAATTPPVK